MLHLACASCHSSSPSSSPSRFSSERYGSLVDPDLLRWRAAVATRCRILRCMSTIFIDRKSTRLNSSHLVISYAVFCLKKKKDNYCSRRFGGSPCHVQCAETFESFDISDECMRAV